MIACPKKGTGRRLLATLAKLQDTAAAGSLPATARWILDSRVIFIPKKGSPVPRPVRIGEVWRRIIAKRLCHLHRTKARTVLVHRNQYGVAVPGATEGLILARAVIEMVLAGDPGGDWALLDLDLANFFPTLEWQSIGDAVNSDLPELSSWTDWAQSEPVRVFLPSGEIKMLDRGAEQGDPLGSLQSSLVLGRVVERTRSRLSEERGELDGSFADVWFIDDGQVLIKPQAVDDFLRILDEELAEVGSSRGEGEGVKSVCRFFGPQQARGQSAEWITERVRRTCKLPDSALPVKVLGALVGGTGALATGGVAVDDQVKGKVSELVELGQLIAEVEDPATELVLTKKCADVTRLQYLLRVGGLGCSDLSLQAFDTTMQASLQRILGAPLPPDSLLRAATGVGDGGLGFRRAKQLSLVAAVASHSEGRPLVEHLLRQCARLGLQNEHVLRGVQKELAETAIEALQMRGWRSPHPMLGP